MPNGNDLTDAIRFEDKLGELTGDELSRFIARQLYQHCEQSQGQDKRIKALEDRGNKFVGAVGGVSGVIGATIASVLDYFIRRGQA